MVNADLVEDAGEVTIIDAGVPAGDRDIPGSWRRWADGRRRRRPGPDPWAHRPYRRCRAAAPPTPHPGGGSGGPSPSTHQEFACLRVRRRRCPGSLATLGRHMQGEQGMGLVMLAVLQPQNDDDRGGSRHDEAVGRRGRLGEAGVIAREQSVASCATSCCATSGLGSGVLDRGHPNRSTNWSSSASSRWTRTGFDSGSSGSWLEIPGCIPPADRRKPIHPRQPLQLGIRWIFEGEFPRAFDEVVHK